MYGTVARFQLKSDVSPDVLAEWERLYRETHIPGHLVTYIYQTDQDPLVFYLATVFENEAAYWANANSPEQHERYLWMMQFLTGDPEWHDGQVVVTVEG